MIKELIVKNNKINYIAVAKHLSVIEDEDIQRIKEMCEQAETVAVAKAIYKVSYINKRENESLVIDETTFKSSLMHKNFENINRVFPFIATCGVEVYNWANTVEDVFERYWADYIMEYILRASVKAVYSELREVYGLEKLASMNPGSLSGWPIIQQRELFSLLDSPTNRIGVTLTDTYLMIPQKSVSGILFPSDSDYVNCKLCDKVYCPSRRAPYDKKVKDELQGE